VGRGGVSGLRDPAWGPGAGIASVIVEKIELDEEIEGVSKSLS